MTPSERHKRVVELLKIVDDFGVTHIITSDGNVADDNLLFVEREMEMRGGSVYEHELLALLREMNEDDRFDTWCSR